MNILTLLPKVNTMTLPYMELINLYYWPLSRDRGSESISADVYVEGLGKVEMKGIALSEETKNAIRSDCLLAMKKRVGI
jgi:hypothetical protein